MGHLTAAQREEKEGTGGACESGTEGHGLSPVSCGTAAESHVFLLACLWFSSAVFRVAPSGASIALPDQEPKMLGSEQNTSQWALKATHGGHFHEDQGLQEPVGFRSGVVWFCCFFVFYFKFQQERCAMFHSDSNLTSLFQTLQCNTNHFEVGKNAKLCLPFICESLRRVLFVYVLSGLILYCFGHVALMTSLHQALSPSEETRRPAPPGSFCSVSAIPPH